MTKKLSVLSLSNLVRTSLISRLHSALDRFNIFQVSAPHPVEKMKNNYEKVNLLIKNLFRFNLLFIFF